MLGRYTPLYALAFDYVPGINLFRRPVDGAFVFVAVLAILAGHLLADYVREGRPRRAGLAHRRRRGRCARRSWRGRWCSRRDRITAGIRCCRCSRRAADRPAGDRSASVGRARRGARIAAAGCVAAVATVELVWWNAASSLNAERAGVLLGAAAAGRRGRRGACHPGAGDRQRGTQQGERPRVEVVGVSGPWQNLAMTRGLEATNGYNPLRIGCYDRLVSPGETTHLVDQRLFPASFDGYDCALARELGLEYVVLGRPIEQVPHLVRRPVSDILLAGPKVWIYRLTDPEPRVRFISRVMVADTDAQVRAGQFRVNPAAANGADRRRHGAHRATTGRPSAARERPRANRLLAPGSRGGGG